MTAEPLVEGRSVGSGKPPYKDYKLDDVTDLQLKFTEALYINPKYVVYFDQRYDVAYESDFSLLSTECNEELTRLDLTLALPLDGLDLETKKALRRVAAAGLVAGLEGNAPLAKSIRGYAEGLILMRLGEVARMWFAGGATVAFLLIAANLLLGSLNPCKFAVVPIHAPTLGFIGAAGAYLSVLLRINQFLSDPSAGKAIHVFDGVARIVAGALGANLVYYAVDAKLLFGNFEPLGNWSAVVVIAFVAGFSERLIPNFVTSIEGRAADSSGGPKVPVIDTPPPRPTPATTKATETTKTTTESPDGKKTTEEKTVVREEPKG